MYFHLSHPKNKRKLKLFPLILSPCDSLRSFPHMVLSLKFEGGSGHLPCNCSRGDLTPETCVPYLPKPGRRKRQLYCRKTISKPLQSMDAPAIAIAQLHERPTMHVSAGRGHLHQQFSLQPYAYRSFTWHYNIEENNEFSILQPPKSLEYIRRPDKIIIIIKYIILLILQFYKVKNSDLSFFLSQIYYDHESVLYKKIKYLNFFQV